MKFENYMGNIGKELIKKIYSLAYSLYATRIVIHKSKYNKYAIVDLFEGNNAICHNYIVSL